MKSGKIGILRGGIIMQVETIETEYLYLRSFQKEDAVFAISIWNDPEMGEYLPDEAMDEVNGYESRTTRRMTAFVWSLCFL